MIRQVFKSRQLPSNGELYFDPENQEFVWSYENGNLSITGNNLSYHREYVENIIATLSSRVDSLEMEVARLKNQQGANDEQ